MKFPCAKNPELSKFLSFWPRERPLVLINTGGLGHDRRFAAADLQTTVFAELCKGVGFAVS